MDRYYQQLLAHNPESTAGILNPGSGCSYPRYVKTRIVNEFDWLNLTFFRHPRSLNPHDRSNSAPNVNINNVKSIGDQRLLLPKGALVF